MADHHYVPRAILRRWQFDEALRPGARRKDGPHRPQMKVWVLDKRNRRFEPKAISAIMCEPDANTVPPPEDPEVLARQSMTLSALRADGNGTYDPEEAEHALGRLDAHVARVVKDVLVPRVALAPEHLDALVAVVFQMRMRGPTWREHYHEDQLAAARLVHLLPGLSDEGHVQLDENEPYLRGQGLLMFPPLERGRVNRARGLRVSVLVAPSDVGFVTCDNPARPFVLDDLESCFSRPEPGLSTPGASVAVTLGPDLCAFVSCSDYFSDGEYVPADADTVRRINTSLLIAAETRVVTPRNDLDVFERWAARKFTRGRLRALSNP